MKKNSINPTDLKKLLPYGAIKVIAKRSNTTIYTVSKVIRGGSGNPLVLNVIKEYIEEIQQTDKAIQNLIAESRISETQS